MKRKESGPSQRQELVKAREHQLKELQRLIKADPVWQEIQKLRHDHNLHKFLKAIWNSYHPMTFLVSPTGQVVNIPAAFKLYTIDSPLDRLTDWLTFDPEQQRFVAQDPTVSLENTAQTAIYLMDHYAADFPALITASYFESWTPQLTIQVQRDPEGCLYHVTAPKFSGPETFSSKADLLIRLYELYSQDIA